MINIASRIDFSSVDQLTLIATIFIAIVGWIIALLIQRSNAKHEHRIQVQYDIYKELLKAAKDTQDRLNTLGATAAPLILMDSCMIAYELKIPKKHGDIFVPTSEIECLLDGERKWSEFTKKVFSDYFAFTNQYIGMSYIFSGWISAISPLIKAQETLAKETDILREKVYAASQELQSCTHVHGHDWRKWDRAEIEKLITEIRDASQTIGIYIHDFMVLAHNELLSKYFDYKKPIRRTLGPEYKVLTSEGLVVSLDKEKIKEMIVNKEKLTEIITQKLKEAQPQSMSEEYENYLLSTKSGICSTCKNPIEVYEAEILNDSFMFKFTCGHSWNGISLKEKITIKELLKTKLNRLGFGRVRTIVQGWKSSGDKKLREGVDYYMDVNKEKNEYHQVVKNSETGEILHEEHEPLTEHK